MLVKASQSINSYKRFFLLIKIKIESQKRKQKWEKNEKRIEDLLVKIYFSSLPLTLLLLTF